MTRDYLMKFCDPKQREFSVPWSAGVFTYATNGHIIVRIDRIPDVEENSDAIKAEVFFKDHLPTSFDDLTPTAISELPPPRQSECKRCDGTGKSTDCEECDGTGTVEWSNSYGHDYEDECKGCNGDGTVKGGETCKQCNGKGTIAERFSVNVGGGLFDREYLAMIEELPGVKFYPVPNSMAVNRTFPPSPFTFYGGAGFIMPMLQ